ncbi:D-ribose ABC transporter substrate-binding protein, partial [Thioclava sp. BHET1]
MVDKTRRLMIGTAAALPLLSAAGGAFAADKGLISIIVNDPANPYWFTEGKVAKEAAEKLGYSATVSAHKG